MRRSLRTLACIVLALLAVAAFPMGTVHGNTQVSQIAESQTGLVKADSLTSGDTSYWRFYGDILSETPLPSIDHQAQVSTNSGTKIPALGLGTANPNDLIILVVALTCGAAATCASPPSVSSVSSSPSLTWNLRNSAANGAVGVSEYYAFAATKASWKITVAPSGSCACVVTAFGVSNVNVANPFDANPASMSSAYGSSPSPSASISTSSGNDMILGMLAQGAATPPPNLKANPASSFKMIVQKGTGNPGNPQEFNVLGADEYEVATTSLNGFAVSFSTAGSYPWAVLADAVAGEALYSYSEDSHGLHIGVQAPAAGTYGGLYAVSPNTSAQLFHATITMPYTSVPSNNYDTGLYVQTSSSHINYVFCGASAWSTGYGWSIIVTSGTSTTATTFTTLWSEVGGPLVGDCTIITNGSNALSVYLNGALVYTSNSLNLNMPSPYNAYLEVETSYAGSTLFGTYTDYYATSSDSLTLQSAPPGDTAEVVDSSGRVLASSAVGANGVALLSLGMYHFPISGNIEVYDSAHNLVASTQSATSIYGGDDYTVSAASYGGPTPPSAPTGLTATATSPSQIDLTWTVPSNDGGSPITGYTIQRSVGGGPFTTIVSNTGSTSTSYSDTGLSASTSYTYDVSAVNSVGASPPSNTASATTLPPTTSTLTVNSELTSGSSITGMYTVLSQGGSQVASGFTPVHFTVNNGQSYTVTVDNYGSYYFAYWLDNLSTNPTRTVSTSANMTLTAVFCSGPCPPPAPPPGESTILVYTVNSAGQQLSGFYITLWQNGAVIGSCFSACSFTVNNGQTYQVAASSYGSETFSHWQNDGSTGFETVIVPSQSTTLSLTAVYSP